MGFWKLEIGDASGHVFPVAGTEEEMQKQYDGIVEAMAAVDGVGPKTVAVSGVCDSVDRAQLQRAFTVESIANVTLCKLY